MQDDMLSKIGKYFHVLHLGEKSLDLGKILSTDTSMKILDVVYNSENRVGLSASEISEALGIGRTTVIYHLRRMQESGLVKLNPLMDNEEAWKKFWDMYRKKMASFPKEQFNRLHDARMNGEKLFVSTKKGFIVLPSTDVSLGESIVREALSSITAPAIKQDHKKLVKSTSLLGTLGVFLIALSFLFQGIPLPQFMSISGEPSISPSELALEKSVSESPLASMESGDELTIEEDPPARQEEAYVLDEEGSMREEAPSSPILMESNEGESSSPHILGGVELNKKANSEEPATTLSNDSPLPESMQGSFEEEKESGATTTEEKEAFTAHEQAEVFQKSENKNLDISKIFSYAGTLLLGSVVGLLFYSLIRKR